MIIAFLHICVQLLPACTPSAATPRNNPSAAAAAAASLNMPEDLAHGLPPPPLSLPSSSTKANSISSLSSS